MRGDECLRFARKGDSHLWRSDENRRPKDVRRHILQMYRAEIPVDIICWCPTSNSLLRGNMKFRNETASARSPRGGLSKRSVIGSQTATKSSSIHGGPRLEVRVKQLVLQLRRHISPDEKKDETVWSPREYEINPLESIIQIRERNFPKNDTIPIPYQTCDISWRTKSRREVWSRIGKETQKHETGFPSAFELHLRFHNVWTANWSAG